VLALHSAWRRLRDMQEVVAAQPAIAHAVRCLPLYDQLELTLELLRQEDWPDFEFEHPEELPPNVIPFRPRRRGCVPSFVCCLWAWIRSAILVVESHHLQRSLRARVSSPDRKYRSTARGGLASGP
jgi:hypothetical protein